jgi:hypothetical protein
MEVETDQQLPQNINFDLETIITKLCEIFNDFLWKFQLTDDCY